MLAFGKPVALTADPVSIVAMAASALPTRSRTSWGPRLRGASPLLYGEMLAEVYLSVRLFHWAWVFLEAQIYIDIAIFVDSKTNTEGRIFLLDLLRPMEIV